MKKTTCKLCADTNCFIKMYCSPEWIQEISSSKYQINFKQNQKIISEGEPPVLCNGTPESNFQSK